MRCFIKTNEKKVYFAKVHLDFLLLFTPPSSQPYPFLLFFLSLLFFLTICQWSITLASCFHILSRKCIRNTHGTLQGQHIL